MSKRSNLGLFPRKTLSAIAVGTALMLSVPAAIAADNTSGTLKGSITSASSTDISNATITVTHQTRGISRTVKSDDNGNYSLKGLPVGRYTVIISKDGYTSIQEKDVVVSLGQSAVLEFTLQSNDSSDVGSENVVQIIGSAVRSIDTSSSTSGVTFSDAELSAMPVSIGFESVALLAPGVVADSGGFDANSFGGGSGAENGYFINGINISHLRTGIGSMPLPWEGIAETQVKTGAISAEFGRFIGGVVNAVAKTGSNELKFGAEINYDPESLRSQHDTIYRNDGSIHTDRALRNDTPQGGEEFLDTNFWASGALVEDKLFFYALYNPRQLDNTYTRPSSYNDLETTADRWMLNVDYFISEDHSLNLFAFSNKEDWRRDSYSYDSAADQIGGKIADEKGESGGDAIALNYRGYLTDDFSVAVTMAQIEQTQVNIPSTLFPLVVDRRDGWTEYGPSTTSTIYDELYERDQLRVDFTYELDDHDIQFGIDVENLEVNYTEFPNGGADTEAFGWWEIFTANEGNPFNLAPGTDYIDRRTRTNSGISEINQKAIYIQDTWQATENLVLNLGLRYAEFENTTTEGKAYANLTGQIAPRIQAIYDLNGDGTTKLFATFGRYYQPIPANMNIKQASGQVDLHTYFVVDQYDSEGRPLLLSDGTPSRGNVIGTDLVESSVEHLNVADNDLEPMYSDEITFGFEMEVFGEMTFGSRYIYRDLKRSIEDGALYAARTAARERWIAAGGTWTNNPAAWVLLNPGSDVRLQHDVDGDGQLDTIVYKAEDIALPRSERTYLALENTLAGQLTDDLYLSASYTWSHNYGNTEGLIRSDNGQADPGWTMSNDFPEATDNGSGDLPNDRRHALKVNGIYNINEELSLGFNVSAVSGGPRNKFGRHPLDQGYCADNYCISQLDSWASGYSNLNFYADGEPSPRGSAGRGDWLYNVDLSLAYQTKVQGGDLTLKATVYNLFNFDTATNIDEYYEAESQGYESDGSYPKNPDYLLPEGRQEARYVTLSARYEF
ncbi:TonB-dependent receptor [Aliikangiella maris]|uniref:TonB-dependent receptor n=2 Tax=Aliikangiella maris TaxID=3162458 RepID=A0ABV3MR32_9GAMM